MKKTYMQPLIEAIEMENEIELLAGSETVGLGQGTIDADDALGREFDFDLTDENVFSFDE